MCITGGSGGIGQALLEQLVRLYRAKALFRTKSAGTSMWEQRGCVPVWGDLSNGESLSELVCGAKYVFHCAALVKSAPYEQAYEVNVEGTRRLAQAAGKSGCKRFIHISSAAVYYGASTADTEYTENSTLSEQDQMPVYARTKLQSELAVQEVAHEYGFEYTILRPTFVYGPKTTSYTLIPIALIRKGMPALLGEGRGMLDAVYVDDLVAASLLAAESPHAAGEIFNIGNEAVSFRDFYSYYAQMLNRPLRSVPIAVARTLHRSLSLTPRTSRIQRGVGFLVNVAENNKRFSSDKARTRLGYTPRFDLPTGMFQTEVWAKKEQIIGPGEHSLDFYGRLPFSPIAIVHPTNEDQLVRIIQTARERRVKVRAIGSLHSQCRITHTDGICIALDGYNKLERVEDCLVTVQAGMKLRNLNNELAKWNLALPVLGSIAEQTVSGAISTATHGGSIHYGSLSDYVESLRILRSDGTIQTINRSNAEFPAAIVSLGLLGIILSVTFRCVSSFALQSRSYVSKAQEVFEQFSEINQRNAYVDMLYFPVTDQVETLEINPLQKQADKVAREAEDETGKKPQRTEFRTIQRLKVLGLRGVALAIQQNVSIQRALTRRLVGGSYRVRSGRSDLVLAFGDRENAQRFPGIINDMEVGIAYERAGEALTVLQEHFRTTQQFPLLPVHIRCSARSSAWLSPAYGRDVCWLEFYSSTGDLFQQVHRLLEPFKYRCHWGKQTVSPVEYLREQYEMWDEFVQLRQAWDREGMFLNDYLAPFFST